MATTFKKKYFSGDLVRGAEQGIVELIGRINLGTYATGGPAVDFSEIHPDCANANIIHFPPAYSEDLANVCAWDAANNKIIAYVRSTDAEVANGTDLNSAVTEEFPVRIVFRVSTAVSGTTTIDA